MDTIKHASLFNNEKFKGTVVVVGLGALGSAVAVQLAKLGIKDIHLIDHDEVENHNLPNQILYGPEHIGFNKVDAAQAMIGAMTGYYPEAHATKLEGREMLRGLGATHLFVCVDSMSVRTEIFKSSVFLNPNMEYYCEGRMSAKEGAVHAFDPRKTEKCKVYMTDTYLYPDSEVAEERGTCGNVLSLGATAMMLASIMIWHFIQAHQEVDPLIASEVINFSAQDLAVHYKGLLV